MKFWNKNDSENEILIYGDICGEQFFDNDVTAKTFADDLKSFNAPITIRINSNGGDCFTALAIANKIKDYKYPVTISIDGICASAATLISCAGSHVKMASNALMMIHLPSVFLYDFFDKIQLSKIQNSLIKVENSILNSYLGRTKLEFNELSAMVEAETWLTADEALKLGFIDEITDAVDTQIDDAKKLLIINSVQIKNSYYTKAKEKLKLNKADLISKIKNLLKGEKVSDKISPIIADERKRIESLQGLKSDNPAVNAIIDVAVQQGATADEIQKYIDAVSNVEVKDSVAEKIIALIEDNLNSGADEIIGSEEKNKSTDRKAQVDLIVQAQNLLQNS